MKNPPSYEDANLILKLYDLRREPRLREARKWFGGIGPITTRDQFLKMCPPGSDENASYRMVTTYWDMAASFVVNGILHPELFYRSNNREILFVWEKVKGATAEMREVQKDPLINKNIQDVAGPFIEYLKQNAPGWYEPWAANIAKMGK